MNPSLRSRTASRPSTFTRRRFLGRSALGASAVALGMPALLPGAGLNEKLNIAVIGVGGRGGGNLGSVRGENIVAVCDVFERSVNQAAQANPRAKKFTQITYQEALQRRLQVMDATAFSLCMDNRMPIIVFGFSQPHSIRRVVMGEAIGTLVTG